MVVWAGDGGPGQLNRQPALLRRVSPHPCWSACHVFPQCLTPPDASHNPCALGHPMEYLSAHWPIRMREKYLRPVSAERPDCFQQNMLWALGLPDEKRGPQIRRPKLRPLDAPPTSIQCPEDYDKGTNIVCPNLVPLVLLFPVYYHPGISSTSPHQGKLAVTP